MTRARANSRNATQSTGPRTPQGKAAVRTNALWHGAFATDLLLPGEDEASFIRLGESFRDRFAPSNDAEDFLVNRMLLAAWRLQRLAAMEVRVMREQGLAIHETAEFLRHLRESYQSADSPEPVEPPPTPKDPIAAAYMRDCRGGNTVMKLSRYQTALERSFYRALHELERLRTETKERT